MDVLKIAIAGFMHDIGKLADECCLHISEEFKANNADLYQPFYDGRFTHEHALYTAAFIENLEAILPPLLSQADWGLEDSFINLAAGHHKPETPLQWIVAIADRLSNGWDRARFEDYNLAATPADYRRTRLQPLFESLMRGSEETAAFCYSLSEVTPETIFPVSFSAGLPANNKVAAEEYKSLFKRFERALGNLLHGNENLALWFEHFESLVCLFGSMIPSARAGGIKPDVSLFDHLKATSAVASALYLYHKRTGSLNIDAIRDFAPKKFLLVAGDLYGIQNFIFSESGETGKNRSKILRGRSFAVSLFSELAADLICQELDLPSISALFGVSGKFVLIAPNLPETCDVIGRVGDRINSWLFRVSNGETVIGLCYQEASSADFFGENFGALWDALAERVDRKKFRRMDLSRFGGAIRGYLDSFRNDLSTPLCPFCGKRPSSAKVESSPLVGAGQSACGICHDHIFLGTNLVKKRRIAILAKDAEVHGADKLIEPIFDSYQLAFLEGDLRQLARTGKLLKYWDIGPAADGRFSKEIAVKFINGYVPIYREDDLHDERLLAGDKSEQAEMELRDAIREGVPKTFAHLANRALHTDGVGNFCGIEALGVLKADVDDLGVLMRHGLKTGEFTLSRLATLSRQINWYFALYLPHRILCDEKFADVYTVFAGGDDLFLIGPWNVMLELAGALQRRFSAYTCGNPEIHLSAGITIHKPHVPLDRLAESTEVALKQSKEQRKNRITIFGETADWNEYHKLREVRDRLLKWCECGMVNTAMLYRINSFIPLAESEQTILKRGNASLEELHCMKWRSHFAYSSERNVAKGAKGEERQSALDEFAEAALWLTDHGGRLKIALWDVLYNLRRQK